MIEKPGKVIGINGNLLTVEFDGAVMQNEVAYARLRRPAAEGGGHPHPRAARPSCRSSRTPPGLRVGDPVEFTGELLSVELGPGLLAPDLRRAAESAARAGGAVRVLPAARHLPAAPSTASRPGPSPRVAKPGDTVPAGDTLGTVPEGIFDHRIMVPVRPRADAGPSRRSSPAGRPTRSRQRRGHGCRTSAARRHEVDHGPALAGQDPDHRLRRAAAPDRAADHQGPHHRHLLPRGPRRHLLHPRPVRRRQDRAAADHQPPRRRGHRDHRRLRRARRRGGGDPARVPGADRPAHGQEPDGAHPHHLQHQLHAGGRARGLGLHRA